MSFVDGFDLKFVSRTQSAERRLHGRLLDKVPVAWTESWRSAPSAVEVDPASAPIKSVPAKGAAKKPAPRDVFIEIGFPDAEELAKQKATTEPFIVALAQVRPKGERTRVGMVDFRGVFEVTRTGVDLSPTSIEARVLRRVTADEERA